MSQTRELFVAPEMAELFTNEAHLRAMLAFEAALARAEARAGIIPSEVARAINDACRIERYDVDAIVEAARLSGAHSIPMVAALTREAGEDAGRYVHRGATSQDVIDSAMMLQARDGLDWLAERLLTIGERCAELAREHRDTPAMGRTLTQHAAPITFGLKAARWLSAVVRQAEGVERVRRESLAAQFGGAVGTLAALGSDGPSVLALLAEELGLPEPELPWHTDRSRVAEIAAALTTVAGTMAKISTDLLLLGQTEVAEASEGVVEGKGGSSAMPHKRNPVDATFALAAARLANASARVALDAMAHEHERGAGTWQAEWASLGDAFAYAGGAVERVESALGGLVVDAQRMRSNLDLTGGLGMSEALAAALAERLGRTDGQRIVRGLVERARETGAHLRDVALADNETKAAIGAAGIERAFDALGQTGSASKFIDRALAAFEATTERLRSRDGS